MPLGVDGGSVAEDALRVAARAGIVDCLDNLAGSSASFSLPAWRKWARMMTDTRNPTGWPRVFADGAGLVGALLSTYEGTEPIGMTGGHLRGLYAQFLDEAAALLDAPALTAAPPAAGGSARTVGTGSRRSACRRTWPNSAACGNCSRPSTRPSRRTAMRAGRRRGPRPPRCGSCGAASTGRRRFDPDRTGQLFRDLAVQLGDLHAAEAAAVDETRRARPAP